MNATKTTKVAVKFYDWDVAARKGIEKVFPAGTKVKDVSRVSSQSTNRMYQIVGLDGWIANIPNSQLSN